MKASPGGLGLTRPLLQWLRQAPGWEALPRLQRAALHWQAALGSCNAALSERLGADAPPPAPPVLIAGP